jgi:stage V sporulation protein G
MENNIIVHMKNVNVQKILTLEGGAQMQITNVRLNKTLNTESKMKAVASVTFDNEFVVHGIKIIDSPKGLFIAMPSREKANGEHKDIAHPINQETRQKIQDAIFKEYEAVQAEPESAEAATEE